MPELQPTAPPVPSDAEPSPLHPDAGALEAFRQRRWGKRPVSVWLLGIGALPWALLGISQLVTLLLEHELPSPKAPAIPITAGALAALCFFFFRLRGSRIAMLASLLALCALTLAGRAYLLLGVFAAATIVGAYLAFDPQLRLFLKLDCSREQLERAWRRETRNPRAQIGLVLAAGAAVLQLLVETKVTAAHFWVFSGPLAIAALTLSILGSNRVSSDARPPVRGRWEAIGGIALSGLTLGGWIVLI